MVAVITMVGVPVEESLEDIEINSIKVVIYLECYVKTSWVRLIGEVCPTKIADKLVDWLTNPPSGEKVPNIDWLITIFHGTKKNYRRPEPDIKSWG